MKKKKGTLSAEWAAKKISVPSIKGPIHACFLDAVSRSAYFRGPVAETCIGSEAGSYLRLIDCVYHATLGWRVIKKKKVDVWAICGQVDFWRNLFGKVDERLERADVVVALRHLAHLLS